MRILFFVTTWMERRKNLKDLVRTNARQLTDRSPLTAYYDAQRAVARARVAGDGVAFLHWTKVAAEVAKSSNAPMSYKITKQIVDDEMLN